MTDMHHQKKHAARCCALQVLYQSSFHTLSPEELIEQFIGNSDGVHLVYFKELVIGTLTNQEKIDELMISGLDRPITALNPVELNILRLALYELLYHVDIPYRVIINEALELAKEFGASEGYKYINGVLDTLKSQLDRPDIKKIKH